MDEKYMKLALEEAEKALKIEEVPVGAVIVYKGQVVGRGFNQVESKKDPTAHAEIIAIRQASKELQSWRLLQTTMYVTLEPCAMCAGAIINSRIKKVFIGTKDKKRGCCGSKLNLLDNDNFNHKVEVEFGILQNDCSQILVNFFKKLRLP